MLTPITKQEFTLMLRRCIPPGGWPPVVAIANSGGPDSTCLLYLFSSVFPKQRLPGRVLGLTGSHFPEEKSGCSSGKKYTLKPSEVATTRPRFQFPRVLSFTIDHALQASSAAMAAHCSNFASKLGVEHVTSKIAWGKGRLPPLPTDSFELAARNARYDLLFENMMTAGCNTLALAHHLDDQVETSLMRLGKGSSLLGARGMKPVRRWGMSQASYGESDVRDLEGMGMWMIRPLLSVGKDRILATCDANGLEYVTDKTNFQPDTTIRNAIRHGIANGGKTEDITKLDFKNDLRDIDKALSSLEPGVSLSSGKDRLREVVAKISTTVESIESQVDIFLHKHRSPSPDGTFFVSHADLHTFTSDPLTRKALIARIMRYMSPHPWGSLQAQAYGKLSRIDRVVETLWGPISQNTPAFVAGSHVVWKPVLYRREKDAFVNTTSTSTGTLGWIAYRQPPAKQNLGLKEQSNRKSLEERDVTELLSDAFGQWKSRQAPNHIEILWDRRFRVRFRFEAMPGWVAQSIDVPGKKFLVRPGNSKWFTPQVVLPANGTDTALSLKSRQDRSQSFSPTPDDWIDIDFVRTLSGV